MRHTGSPRDVSHGERDVDGMGSLSITRSRYQEQLDPPRR
jgi:hypothetical protein